jgi:uncharacterized membrane protein YfcA
LSLDVWTVVASSAAVLAASVLRGFSGFGIALAGVPLLSLVVSPRLAVPTVMVLMIASGLQTLPRDHGHVEWGTLARLLPGAVLGIVPGLWLLAWLSADAARLVIGTVVVGTVILLHRGWRMTGNPGTMGYGIVGALSGVLNGLAAIPGPPVIALYFALERPAAAIRATLAAYFLVVSTVAIVMALFQELVRPSDLFWVLALAPALFLGTALGARLFRTPLQRHYRPIGLAVLLAAGLMAASRGGYALWLG